jgi:hypothetical protein
MNMKKHLIVVFTWGLLIGFNTPVFAQYDPGYWDAFNFGQELFYESLRDAQRIPYRLNNETGVNIQEIYISLSSSDSWGRNLWQSEKFFPSGHYVEMKSDEVGPYDIKLVDDRGREYVKTRVRITTALVITFTPKDRK